MSFDSVAKAIPKMTYEEQVNLMELLMDSIKKALLKRTSETENKTDFTNTYPKGYFNLFGSDPTFPEEPEDIPVDLDSTKEIF